MLPNTSVALQTKLEAEAHKAEEQLLIEALTLNKQKPLIYRGRTRRPKVSKKEIQNLDPSQI